jgi:hypothetical protein
VVFYHHEERGDAAFRLVASSFGELLDLLY